MLSRISSMSEQDVVELYELVLLKEKLRLRGQISDQADRENAAGVWSDLPGFIKAYRSCRKTA